MPPTEYLVNTSKHPNKKKPPLDLAKTHWILKSLTKKNCIYTFYKSWTRFVCKVLYSYAVHSFTHQHDNGSSYSSPYSSTK
ncbi:unnamed protein product [Rhizophagus irregularis]|nr:unnamed protein product [Rhizophagus irregularis]